MNEDKKSDGSARGRHASEVGEPKMESELHDRAARPRIDDQVVDAIGRQLKASYDKLLAEPVPDRFLELLNQLGEKGATGTGDRSDQEKK